MKEVEDLKNRIEGLRKFVKDQQDTIQYKNDLIKRKDTIIDDYQEITYKNQELILQLELENSILKKEIRRTGLFVDETGVIKRL